MVYNLQFVDNHPVYRLNEAIGSFLQQGLNRKAFNDQCYPAWFAPVVSGSPALKRRMQEVFKLAKLKNQVVRDSIVRVWKGIEDIQKLCESVQTKLWTWEFADAALCKALADLFDYLYKETLESTKLNAAIGSSLRDHYESFIALGQAVCAFCGLKNYEDPQSGSRSSYDHFLPRRYYPLGTVNFRNLVPMCDRCNGASGKGSKDVLFTDKTRAKRRRFLYPFATNGGVELKTTCTKRPTPGNLGAWKISAKAIRNTEKTQVEGWVSVFGIDARYRARIRQGMEIWVKDFLNTKRYTKVPTVDQLRRDLALKGKWLSQVDQLRTKAEAALQAAAFLYLAQDAPNDMVAGWAARATSPAVVGIPTAFGRN